MFFEQFIRNDIGCAAYLAGSTDAGEAAVIDPRIDMVDDILAAAAREGLKLRYIVETHTHADHVSGHHALAARTGATIATHQLAGVAYPHLDLQDGDVLALGEVRLRMIHTPGHRPEHLAIGVIDSARGTEPWVVLTGDSLFIGDAARPDLAVPGVAGAKALYHSLHERLLTLPDGTMIYPAHVSGSLCGRVTNRMTGSTVGYERHYNPALALATEDEFVRYSNEGLPERPPNMTRIVEMNRGAEAPVVTSAVPCTAPDVVVLREGGAAVLDVRSSAAFSAGHIPGAISVDFNGGQFQNRVGLVLPADRDLLLVTEHDSDAERVTAALAVIGYTRISGYLQGGMAAWSGRPVETLVSVLARDVPALQAERTDLLLVDVREPAEWNEGHIPGAIHVPFGRIERELGTLPVGPLALICGGGTRSVIAASIVQAHGRGDLYNIEDGMDGWNAAGMPVVAGAMAV